MQKVRSGFFQASTVNYTQFQVLFHTRRFYFIFPLRYYSLSDINAIFYKEVGSTKICRIVFYNLQIRENQTK